jgi:hypothetical protein
MPKDKLTAHDYAMFEQGITTPAMQEAQNEAIRNAANNISSQASRIQEAGGKAIEHCAQKHFLNGDGLRGAQGDLNTAKCLATETVKNYATSSVTASPESQIVVRVPCVILKIDHIEYDNPFLSQHSPESILDIYRRY